MPLSSQTVYLLAALGCACVATVFDLRSRRIPNRLTGPAILLGLLLHLVLGGPAQLGLSLAAGLIAGCIFLLFFIAGGMGAGDVKLMTAIGCLAGMAYIKDVLLATVIIGAVMGVCLAVYRGRLRTTLANVFTLMSHHSEKGLAEHPELNVRNVSTLRLPYALPIAVGCLITAMMAFTSGVAR